MRKRRYWTWMIWTTVNTCALVLAFARMFTSGEPHTPSNFAFIFAIILAAINIPFTFHAAKQEYQRSKDPVAFVFILVSLAGFFFVGCIHGIELIEPYLF